MPVDTTARVKVQQICAVLLRYPEAELNDLLPIMLGELADLPSTVAVDLAAFLEHARTTSLLERQQHYVETFDMRRKCSPYLTYWTHGDTRNRGMALLHFKRAYRRAGLTIDEKELPDHLAVVLEFAAAGDAELGNALLAEHRRVIGLLHESLAASGSPYEHVLAAVAATTAELTAEDEVLMRELAQSGPPTETVGMAGPVDLTLTPFAMSGSDSSMGARR